MHAALFAAILAPFSAVTTDTLMDTPILQQHLLWQAVAADLEKYGGGMRLLTGDERPEILTETGFRLEIRAGLPAGHVTLQIDCLAPTNGSDSYFVELDGERLPQQLLLPKGRFGNAKLTFPVHQAGTHTLVITLREAPGSRIRSLSLTAVSVQSPRPPMLESHRARHPRLLLTPDSLARFRQRLAEDGATDFYTFPVSELSRRAPAYQPGKRNGGPYRTLGDFALAHLLEPSPAMLTRVLEWLEEATTYGDVGVDLDAEYFLEGLALSYDWLYDEIPPDLRDRVREQIAAVCRTLFSASLSGKSGGGLSYQQNHYWYSHLALALGAAALSGDVPEADAWLAWAWDRFERIALTFSAEGSFHEGPGYWDFSMPTLYMYVDLYETLTGLTVPEPMRSGLRGQGQFRFHHLLPGLNQSAPLEDSKVGIGTSAPALYLWEAKRFQDPLTAALPAALAKRPASNRFNLLWHDPKLTGGNAPADLPTARCYEDIGTAFMRTSWDADATFAAFVCRPLGGHAYAEICDRCQIGGTGHNHPAQGHFILFAGGELLAADPGYTYEKKTRNHNTILVDGKGQYGDGEMWPRPTPGRAHIIGFAQEHGRCIVSGAAASAYPEDCQLTRFDRTLVLAGPDFAVVFDRLAAAEPRRFSWLLHHWGSVEQHDDSQVITVNNVSLTLQPHATETLSTHTETYRPQFVHPTRNLTPDLADINLLSYETPPLQQLDLLVPMVIGAAGTPAPPVTCRRSDKALLVTFQDHWLVFNLSGGTIDAPLPDGTALRTAARTLLLSRSQGNRSILLELPRGSAPGSGRR